MDIFSKWHFFFSGFVVLQIFKVTTKGIYSTVLGFFDWILLIINCDISTAFNRTNAQSFHNHGFGSTRPHASKSVNGTTDVGISDFQTEENVLIRHINRHEVISKTSDLSQDSTYNFPQSEVIVKGARNPVCLKRGSSDPFTDPVPDSPDQVPMTSQCGSISIRNLPERSAHNMALETASKTYVKYLIEIAPILDIIESEICGLCKKHFNKSVINTASSLILRFAFHRISVMSRLVNSRPYRTLVGIYLREMKEILRIFHIDVVLSMKKPNSKVSSYQEKYSCMVKAKRSILFYVSKDASSLKKQLTKPRDKPKQTKRKRQND